MNFERGVIRFAQYVFALLIVTAIAIYFGVSLQWRDIVISLLIGVILAVWESR